MSDHLGSSLERMETTLNRHSRTAEDAAVYWSERGAGLLAAGLRRKARVFREMSKVAADNQPASTPSSVVEGVHP